MNNLLDYLKQEEWSPYTAGGLLGLVVVATLLFTGMMPGSSASFINLAAVLGQHLAAPGNTYIAPQEVRGQVLPPLYPPGVTWQVVFVGGIFLGALASSLLAGSFGGWREAISDRQWRAVFGDSVWKRWLIIFVGGVVVEFGAGVAGGCTSGLAIAGGVQLAPAAFLFMPAMFISGIPTALIMYGRRY